MSGSLGRLRGDLDHRASPPLKLVATHHALQADNLLRPGLDVVTIESSETIANAM